MRATAKERKKFLDTRKTFSFAWRWGRVPDSMEVKGGVPWL